MLIQNKWNISNKNLILQNRFRNSFISKCDKTQIRLYLLQEAGSDNV